MTFKEYQQEAVKFRTSEANCAEYLELGLIEEIGEVAGKLAKRKRDGVFDKLAFISELGDVLWFVANLAQYNASAMLDWDDVNNAEAYNEFDCVYELTDLVGFIISKQAFHFKNFQIAVCYVRRLAEIFGFTLEQVAEANIFKLKDRASRGVINGNGDER